MNFACLKAGTAYGPEYVNRLASMIGRNLKQDFRLFCLTDDPAGIDERVDILPLPEGLEKWWGKLYLFKPGVLPEGRVIYLDLDTLIVGPLDEIVKYDGSFATLIDFYWPHLIGPAVMMWKAGDHEAIWTEWEAQGRPTHELGDLWWLNTIEEGRFLERAERLQLLYPYQFISYKVHCNDGVNNLAKVICFHGQPKPHNCGQPWVAEVWR